jgi:hypothetical protein
MENVPRRDEALRSLIPDAVRKPHLFADPYATVPGPVSRALPDPAAGGVDEIEVRGRLAVMSSHVQSGTATLIPFAAICRRRDRGGLAAPTPTLAVLIRALLGPVFT